MRLVTENNKLEFIPNKRLRMRRARAAAKSLMIQLRISRRDQLLFILGYPEAIDNEDAIRHWILAQEPMLAVTKDSYSELNSKLESLLIDATEGSI
jgi:hypothetical protein